MTHRIRIKVKDLGQAKRFIRFAKAKGLIYSDISGELCIKDNFDKKIDNASIRVKRKKERIENQEINLNNFIDKIIEKGTL